MVNDSVQILRKKFLYRFSLEKTDRIFNLIQALSQEDPFLQEDSSSSLENLLLLSDDQVEHVLPFLEGLKETSYFAASFYLEKIPVLLFYGIWMDFTNLVESVKNFSGRNVAYAIGSTNLNHDDIEDIIKVTDVQFYKRFLKDVLVHCEELKILCGPILRQAHAVSLVLKDDQAEAYFKICAEMNEFFSYTIAIAFIGHTFELLEKHSLDEFRKKLSDLESLGHEYIEYSLKFPDNFYALQPILFSSENTNYLKKRKLEILKNNSFEEIQSNPTLLRDKYFYSLLSNWERYEPLHKKNIIAQLETPDYKRFLLTFPQIQSDLEKISENTKDHWFSFWSHAEKPMTFEFIYGEIKKTLIPNANYRFLTRKIYKMNQSLFEQNKKSSSEESLSSLLGLLLLLAKNEKTKKLLISFKQFLKGDFAAVQELYSRNNLYMKIWDRDPWIDYARSDELYSCTSIGKSADIYAPCYLADININNLDIWTNNLRIGRIHLLLAKAEDESALLLVDSIEGSDRLMRNKKRLNMLYNGVLGYAKFLSIDQILFNSNLQFNNTPKLFIKYLVSQNLTKKQVYVKRFILDGSTKETMIQPYISFLESLKNKNAGLVEGFLIKSLELNG